MPGLGPSLNEREIIIVLPSFATFFGILENPLVRPTINRATFSSVLNPPPSPVLGGGLDPYYMDNPFNIHCDGIRHCGLDYQVAVRYTIVIHI